MAYRGDLYLLFVYRGVWLPGGDLYLLFVYRGVWLPGGHI